MSTISTSEEIRNLVILRQDKGKSEKMKDNQNNFEHDQPLLNLNKINMNNKRKSLFFLQFNPFETCLTPLCKFFLLQHLRNCLREKQWLLHTFVGN